LIHLAIASICALSPSAVSSSSSSSSPTSSPVGEAGSMASAHMYMYHCFCHACDGLFGHAYVGLFCHMCPSLLHITFLTSVIVTIHLLFRGQNWRCGLCTHVSVSFVMYIQVSFVMYLLYSGLFYHVRVSFVICAPHLFRCVFVILCILSRGRNRLSVTHISGSLLSYM